MTSWTLAARSLRFYWRTHLGVLLGIALSTAILVGALVVGDSVDYTLKTLALSRLGEVHLALASQDRYFRDDLAAALSATSAPVLQRNGIVSNDDGTARVNRAQVLGVDNRFLSLLNAGSTISLSGNEAIINERLAEHIGIQVGDDILLRMQKASVLPSDAPMSMGEDSIALRMTVKAVAPDSGYGRFSLQASQIAPFNVFLPIERLQERLELSGRANILLIGGDSNLNVEAADRVLRESWKLADADLELRELPEQDMLELRTNRVFFDPPVVSVAKRVMPEAIEILTYFVNEMRLGDHTTPYSMISAIKLPASHQSPITNHLNSMADDEILINEWLADDLQASIGDTIELTYLVFGPMRKLEERKGSFRVNAILPMEGLAADPDLMPLFPGVYNAENSREWEPGIPIDLEKIRDKDEDYWDRYRGTPKAFVTLNTGQKLWGNRFGELTALRTPLDQATDSKPMLSQLETKLKDELDPASVGLFFRPVREQALKASAEAIDFGQLFLGLSFFLIAAALLLTGLLFVFGIEQRTEEMGTLLALGFPARQVRRIFLLEGGALALVGGILGLLGGILYTKIVLFALSNVWQDAVRTAGLRYHAEPMTLFIGIVSGIIIALFAIWITSRRQAKRPARELLAAGGEFGSHKGARSSSRFIFSLSVTVISIAAALVILIAVGTGRDTQAAGAFFGAGALLLIGGLGLSHIILARLSSWIARRGLTEMGMRNSVRRWGRSLVTVGLLACGSFLVIAVGANRHDAMKDADKRWSGTGGFALYGESTLPILHDLNSKDGQDEYNLDTDKLENVDLVPFRVREGDDASCLNLNRAQIPRLMGIRPADLQSRGAFTFTETIGGSDDPWMLLNESENSDTVNAIGDQGTITWAIGKSVGDTLAYTDERGQTFNIKIVGAIANSILQGSFLIAEDEFIKRFPSESGYRTFLIDAPPNNVSQVSGIFTSALQDVGLELTPAARRLEEFNSVQNTYLAIFQSLGGLALLLGSVGLGIVVLRNVMERRGELALLRAVGFRNSALQWLVFSEHWLLLILGLICGVIAGIVAVLPALQSPGADIPYVSLAITLLAILLSGALWTWLATRLALRGPLLSALRNE